MTDGASSTVAAATLASVLNGAGFTSYGPVFVQLHIGAPGAGGTANVASNATRQSAGTNPGFSTGASVTNLNAVNWISVPTTETYTHVSLWSASSGGTFIASGAITANPVVSGDNFSIPVSDMAVSIPAAS